MHLPNNITSAIAIFAKLPQQKIARVMSILLLGYIAFLFGKLTWLLLTPEPKTHQVVNTYSQSTRTKSSETLDIRQFISLNLFGIYNQKQVVEEVEEEITNAPETKLNLVLAGVVPSSEDETASAIIEHKGVQETLGIGDKIADTRATLHKVYFDRVIIKRSGISETLMLDGLDFQKTGTSGTKSKKSSPQSKRDNDVRKSLDNRNNASLRKQAINLKSALADDPGKLTDYLRISPKVVGGETVGYFLRPGKNPNFFKESGLKSGDVAIQLNGYDLTSALDAAQALQALKTEPEAAIVVDRNGEITEILLSIEN